MVGIYEVYNKYIAKDNPPVQQVEPPKVLGSYTIESLTLKAIDCLNDSKGDDVNIQIFADKQITNNQELICNELHTMKKGDSVDVNSSIFNREPKETFIFVRLYIKDKDNGKDILVDEQSINLKVNNGAIPEFTKHYPLGRMVRYSLEHKISQKGGS